MHLFLDYVRLFILKRKYVRICTYVHNSIRRRGIPQRWRDILPLQKRPSSVVNKFRETQRCDFTVEGLSHRPLFFSPHSRSLTQSTHLKNHKQTSRKTGNNQRIDTTGSISDFANSFRQTGPISFPRRFSPRSINGDLFGGVRRGETAVGQVCQC